MKSHLDCPTFQFHRPAILFIKFIAKCTEEFKSRKNLHTKYVTAIPGKVMTSARSPSIFRSPKREPTRGLS